MTKDPSVAVSTTNSTLLITPITRKFFSATDGARNNATPASTSVSHSTYSRSKGPIQEINDKSNIRVNLKTVTNDIDLTNALLQITQRPLDSIQLCLVLKVKAEDT